LLRFNIERRVKKVNIKPAFRARLILYGLVSLLIFNTLAQAQWDTAQNFCFPNAVGVPGMPGPPDWWSAPGAQRDDPRWRGSSQRTWGPGGVPEASLRALYSDQGGERYLYLFFDVRFDPSLDTIADTLIVTFATQTLDHRIIIFPIADQSPKTAANPSSIDYATRPAGTNNWTGQPIPAWLTDQTRVWVSVNGMSSDWTVQLRVPATTLGLNPLFGLYSSLLVATPGGVLQHHFPRNAPNINEVFGAPDFANGIPPVNTWGQGNLVNDPVCSAGVSIAWNQIGTTNAIPHQMNISSPNTFFARPHNGTNNQVNSGEIVARFRLANWGAMAPGGPWRDISPPGGVASTLAIPATSDAPVGTIQFNWTPSAAEQPFYTANPHQCMLVELTSPANLDFSSDSIVRNMDFVTASTHSREAEISVEGAGNPPAGEPAHRIWAYVEEINLPRPTLTTRLRGSFDALLGWFRSRDREVVGWKARQSTGQAESVAVEPSAQEPTYRVHVYIETGEHVTIGGSRRPVLTPLGNYGYFISHEGGLTGWNTNLKGLEQRGPNVYTATVAQGGVIKVTDTIEAEEPTPFIALGILLLLLILLFLIVKWLRRSKTA